MVKLYAYVEPEDIRRKTAAAQPGLRVDSSCDLGTWLRASGQHPDRHGLIAVTFVVDEGGCLRVADRGSEHVACSGGGPVRSAGELFLRCSGTGLEVAEASNQSTGFCPEPESWPTVAAALDRLGLPHPGRFTQEV